MKSTKRILQKIRSPTRQVKRKETFTERRQAYGEEEWGKSYLCTVRVSQTVTHEEAADKRQNRKSDKKARQADTFADEEQETTDTLKYHKIRKEQEHFLHGIPKGEKILKFPFFL